MTSSPSDDGFTLVVSRRNKPKAKPRDAPSSGPQKSSSSAMDAKSSTPQNGAPVTKSSRRSKLKTEEISVDDAADATERVVWAAKWVWGREWTSDDP
jgi:hypothetical protein